MELREYDSEGRCKICRYTTHEEDKKYEKEGYSRHESDSRYFKESGEDNDSYD